MANNTPFKRFNMVMAAIAGIMAQAAASKTPMSRAEAFQKAGGYESRGHGRGENKGMGRGLNRPHQRLMAKKRNVARNRAAHRG